jgi:hypothetical protein
MIITRKASTLLGGLRTMAFYHFGQGETIVAVLIVICVDWIVGRMKDQLLVRRWHQMPLSVFYRHAH